MITHRLFQPCQTERRWSAPLRSGAVAAIETEGPARVAPQLGLAPSGVAALLFRQEWDLPTALRVAEGLRLPVRTILAAA